MAAVSVRLTGRAARWVQLVQDFGHLDLDGVDRLLIAVADLHADSGAVGDLVDLPTVRRAAAILLANPGRDDDGQLPMILEEDWPLLFG